MRPRAPILLIFFTLVAGCDGPRTDAKGRPRPIKTIYSTHPFKADADLGYALVPGRRVSVRKSYAGETAYAVTYTIDEHGFRAAPGNSPASARPVLFFGDSYTFGEGVEDGQAYPAVLQAASGGRLRAVNLGVMGYGPHHMLRLLERERERPALNGRPPIGAVYLALSNHPARAAGRAAWDIAGPRYEVGTDGSARYAGPFHGPLKGAIVKARLLARAFLSRKDWREDWDDTRRPEDVALFVSVVASAARSFRARYDRDLLVVLLDGSLPAGRLRAKGVVCLRADDLLPPHYLQAHRLKYDGHPDAEYHRRLGEALVRRLAGGSA